MPRTRPRKAAMSLVFEANNDDLDVLGGEEMDASDFQAEINSKQIKEEFTIQVMTTTNPCTYVNIGGRYFKICY